MISGFARRQAVCRADGLRRSSSAASLMTTDPGDLVLRPHLRIWHDRLCAETLGRRWITCDTSRVAINVARQRLCRRPSPHYRTRNGKVSGNFLYKTVPSRHAEEPRLRPRAREGRAGGPAGGGQGRHPRLRPLRGHVPRPLLGRGLEGLRRPRAAPVTARRRSSRTTSR